MYFIIIYSSNFEYFLYFNSMLYKGEKHRPAPIKHGTIYLLILARVIGDTDPGANIIAPYRVGMGWGGKKVGRGMGYVVTLRLPSGLPDKTGGPRRTDGGRASGATMKKLLLVRR